MKRSLALVGLILGVCALAGAQENASDRSVVPARNTSHPRVLNVSVSNGSITVQTYNGKEVIVETRGESGRERPDKSVDGLRRLRIPGRGIDVEEDDNVITVRAPSSSESLVITVPADTSAHLRSSNGHIEADGLHGEIEASSPNGRITLTNITGTVVADSRNGAVKVTMNQVDSGKPISVSSYNGDVDVTLPADFKANLKLKANQGDIWSDFDIKLTPGQPITEKSNSSNGKYRVRMDRNVTGTINGGGTDATFTTYNGKIMIRKK